MSIRNKSLIGGIRATVNDNDKNNIVVTVQKEYTQLEKVEGNGLSLKDNKVVLNCDLKNYKKKMEMLNSFIYELECTNAAVEKELKKKGVKNANTNTSTINKANQTGTAKSNSRKGNEENSSK